MGLKLFDKGKRTGLLIQQIAIGINEVNTMILYYVGQKRGLTAEEEDDGFDEEKLNLLKQSGII